MNSIGMLLVMLVVGVAVGIAGAILFRKHNTTGSVATDPKLQAYVDGIQSQLQAQVNELKTKLLPADVQEKLKDVGDGLWETFKAKVLVELSTLKVNGESHLQQIEALVQHFETLTKEELVKLHLEKEEVKPEVVPVLTASPASPQTVVSSAPATPVVDDQNKTV
ncbi:hypothetical protein AH04_20 [Erwinia phage AH04]|uniref:Uncharacterized protein n=1 Tax=Erwinia phage AH04 TaxID=2869569 RepID=A0AAE7X0F6_9CAUD|nr:hypothetical protein PQC02_gp294 [Erwinia phage AH04]QZA70507.1 hypothetical protein AH04_20 [Erwinia phage AH04]